MYVLEKNCSKNEHATWISSIVYSQTSTGNTTLIELGTVRKKIRHESFPSENHCRKIVFLK